MAITIFELSERTCRYPVGVKTKGEPTFYCGDPTWGPTASYCETHHKLCYTSGSATKRERSPIMLPVDRIEPRKPDPEPRPIDFEKE